MHRAAVPLHDTASLDYSLLEAEFSVTWSKRCCDVTFNMTGHPDSIHAAQSSSGWGRSVDHRLPLRQFECQFRDLSEVCTVFTSPFSVTSSKGYYPQVSSTWKTIKSGVRLVPLGGKVSFHRASMSSCNRLCQPCVILHLQVFFYPLSAAEFPLLTTWGQ